MRYLWSACRSGTTSNSWATGRAPRLGTAQPGRLRKACVFQLAPTQHALRLYAHAANLCQFAADAHALSPAALLHKPSRTSQELQENSIPPH